jgi:hypothetical protein
MNPFLLKNGCWTLNGWIDERGDFEASISLL